MAKYRKKPVVTEAWLTSELLEMAAHSWRLLPAPIADAYESGDLLFADKRIHIKTLEGTMTAERTDMVVRGIKGELYPIKAEIFAATYDKEQS
jgi:hypothetical protein